MLNLNFGKSERLCDGTSRRSFLKIGALAAGGLSLADLLRAEAAAGIGSSHKAVINIHLTGGPTHLDTFDLKPQAAVEFRGELNPIATNVAGIQICELLPKLAQMADSYTIIRSLIGSSAGHSNFQTHTGFNQRSLVNVGGRPSIGAVVSRLQGSGPGGAPGWISYNGGEPGFLGPVHRPYQPGSGAQLTLLSGMTEDRLSGRTNLLSQLDNIRREADSSGQMRAMDSYTDRAVDIVTSGRVATALELNKEAPEIVERYGRSNATLLRARRLIESGVRVVTTNASWGGWDTHGENFKAMRRMLPQLDQGVSTLIWDLKRLGMFEDVAVVIWGEFGRTPRINAKAGRDHWPAVSPAFITGGNFSHGQVIGSTDRIGAYAADRPVHFQNVLATLYHHLGINTETTTITDHNGRPQYLLDERSAIHEMI